MKKLATHLDVIPEIFSMPGQAKKILSIRLVLICIQQKLTRLARLRLIFIVAVTSAAVPVSYKNEANKHGRRTSHGVS